MKSIQIDDETAHRLRVFIASENSGTVHGKIGVTAAKAINRYINQEEKYIDDLAKKALGKMQKSTAGAIRDCIAPPAASPSTPAP